MVITHAECVLEGTGLALQPIVSFGVFVET